MQKCNWKRRNLIRFSKIMPPIFWTLIIFAFDMPYVAIATLIAALIHECGHIAAMLLITGGFKLGSELSGLRLTGGRNLSYKEESVIAAAGPIANLLAFIIFLPFNDYTFVLAILNLCTAISNLLPIESYDGYRILTAALDHCEKGDAARSLLSYISLFTSATVSILSLYLIRSFGGGHWIFFIFIAAVIKSLKKDERVLFARKNEKNGDFGRFQEVSQRKTWKNSR